MDSSAAARPPTADTSPRTVFLVFLRLGLTSFGGPVAHLGYFRLEFVERRGWLSDRAYADLVALCQFLPGPASSQVGMALGLQRAGLRGLLAAWLGFTLPSAALLFGVALGVAALGDLAGAGWVLGLQAAAVGVVAHAVLGMGRALAPDLRRATIAAVAAGLVLLLPGSLVIPGVLLAAGATGLLALPGIAPSDTGRDRFPVRVRRGLALACLGACALRLAGLPLLAALTGSPTVSLIDTFTRSGALVFGGGHAVLPLLQAGTVETGLVDQTTFLAGYGAAQAVPGPLFAVAAFLGAVTTSGPTGLAGAVIALVAIFLVPALLVLGVLPFWGRLRHSPRVQRALAGMNAGVVGVLGAALIDPVFLTGVTSMPTFALAALSALGLAAWRVPAWAVVLAAAGLGGLVL